MQYSHKFKDETLDFNKIWVFFFLEVAPSHASGPPEEHTFSLSSTLSYWVPHLNQRTKKMITVTIFSILLKTVHN